MKIGNPSNKSFILNCPIDFDLDHEIKEAEQVYVATAFARMTGWKLIREAVKANQENVVLLAGLDFFQTEESVLSEWISDELINANAYVYSGAPTFHPKVMLIKHADNRRSFAIIGSGNMTEGGYIKNIECNVYVNSEDEIKGLEEWLEAVISTDCTYLEQYVVDAYGDKRKKLKKARSELDKAQNKERSEIRKLLKAKATMLKWNDAKRDFHKYRNSDEFHQSRWYELHEKAVQEIRRCLDYPEFNIVKSGWDGFYSIESLGDLDNRTKDKIFSDEKSKLTEQFKILIDDDIDIVKRINAVVDHDKDGIKGIGLNTASKILTAHDINVWPVINKPVVKALEVYGYKKAKTTNDGIAYAAFAELMQKFKSETNCKDMLELDCFFYWAGKKALEEEKRKKGSKK